MNNIFRVKGQNRGKCGVNTLPGVRVNPSLYIEGLPVYPLPFHWELKKNNIGHAGTTTPNN